MNKSDVRQAFMNSYNACIDRLTYKQYTKLSVADSKYEFRLDEILRVTKGKKIAALVAEAKRLLPEYKRSFMRLVA